MDSSTGKFVIETKKLGGLVFGALIVFYVVLTYVAFLYEELKYLKYALPSLSIIFILVLKKTTIIKSHIKYFGNFISLYLLLFSVSFLVCLSNGIYERFFVEVFLVFCPMIFAFTLSFFYRNDYKKDYVRIMFFGTFGLYLFEKGGYFIQILGNPQLLILAIKTSTIDSESGLSFIFGIFFLHYLMEGKEKKYFWLSLILCLVSFKRIAFVGILLCSLFWFFFRNHKRTIAHHRLFFVSAICLGNILLVVAFYQLISGNYDEMILQYTGLSPNEFMMGRYNLYSSVLSFVGDLQLFGIGFGKISQTLQDSGSALLNFHSDILKNFIELGPIFFLIWLFNFLYFNSINLKLFVMALFLNILFISDNVFIYFEVMFYFYIFAIVYLSEHIESTSRPNSCSA